LGSALVDVKASPSSGKVEIVLATGFEAADTERIRSNASVFQNAHRSALELFDVTVVAESDGRERVDGQVQA
jgi:hypothetical protein